MYPGATYVPTTPAALTVQVTSAAGGVWVHDPLAYPGQLITGSAGLPAATFTVDQDDQPPVASSDPPAQSLPSEAFARTKTVWSSANAVPRLQETFDPSATYPVVQVPSSAAEAEALASDVPGAPLGIDPDTGRARRFAYPPNLVVVDGGAPQVAAAQRALDELGVSDVALCGLAKRHEEVWLPGEAEPVILPRTSEGLYLLQRVRDEAHRFAIAYHRQKRSKAMTTSGLDGVAGLGEARKKALLRHFGSLKRLRAASVEEVMEVPGVGRRTAETVVAALAGVPEAAPSFDPVTGEVVQ
jgi:hypothetical protein